jgi:hypothetical protein
LISFSALLHTFQTPIMKKILYSVLAIVLFGPLGEKAQAQVRVTTQTYLPSCAGSTSEIDYRNNKCSPREEKRSDTEAASNASFTFSDYTSTVAGAGVTTAGRANDVFQFTGSSTAYSSQIVGPSLIWRQNSTATNLSSDRGDMIVNSPYKAQVTITFSREVKNLKLVFQDIDKALLNANQGSDFTDEVSFYPLNAAGKPTSLASGNVQVGFGPNALTTSANQGSTCKFFVDTRDAKKQAVLQGYALNGGATGNPSRNGNATIVFTEPVKTLVLTYRNLFTVNTSQLRLQTIAIEEISWCSAIVPLPVTLTTFDATTVGNETHLAWTTVSETNNEYFGVERSFDGKSFSSIGRVAGHGSTTSVNSYTYTDAGVATKATGTVYYRLQQVDQDGTATYSPVRVVALDKGATSLKLYPNPTALGDNKLTLDLLTLPKGDYQASVLNVLGNAMATYIVHGGEAQPLVLPSALAPGTYVVLVQGQGMHLMQRLARQ